MRLGLSTLARRQPTQQPLVARNTALGAALAASVVPSVGVNPGNGKRVLRSANAVLTATSEGIATQHAATDSAIDFGAAGGMDTVVPIGTAITVFLRLYVAVTGVRQIYLADFSGAGAGESFNLELTAANQYRFSLVDSTLGTRDALGTTAVTVGWHDVMAVYVPGVGSSLYLDRALIGNVSFTPNLRAGVSLRLGMPGLVNSLGFQGRMAVCHIFQGDQSAYRSALSQNPWQVFKSQPTQFVPHVVGGGATDTPINPAAASITVAGYAPTIARTANQSVAPGAGSIAITGYAPSITQSAAGTITPATGAITVTGYAPTVTRTASLALSPAAKAIAITGYAPTVFQGVPAVTPDEYSATIMRANAVNSTGTMRAEEINQTANLL